MASPARSATDSSSDDDADMPELPQIFYQCRTPPPKDNDTKLADENYSTPAKRTRLDDLLSDHKKEVERCAKLEEARELMETSELNSQELNLHSQSLASDMEDHLERINVSTMETAHNQPGIELFKPDQYCCLFSETTCPATWGFTSSNSAIDRAICNLNSENMSSLFISKALVASFRTISNVESVLIWLLNILSVHSSPIIVNNCYINLTGMLKKISEQGYRKENRTHFGWCPTVLELLRIFVNYGADHKELTGPFSQYSEDEIRKFLTVENDENRKRNHESRRQLQAENVRKLLEYLAAVYKIKPNYSKDDTSLLMFMLFKIALDRHLLRSVGRELQLCVDLLLSSYDDKKWHEEVPSLCRHLQQITDCHNNRRHMIGLFLGGVRGSYVKTRLSFIFLRDLLTAEDFAFDDLMVTNYSLSLLPNLGQPHDKGNESKMSSALRQLAKTDVYKLKSAVFMLDRAVGDLYRSAEARKDLEVLVTEVNHVVKTMKDSLHNLELSKVKDTLARIKFKWSLTLENNHRTVQRTIFQHFTTESQQPSMQTEVLTDKQSSDDELL